MINWRNRVNAPNPADGVASVQAEPNVDDDATGQGWNVPDERARQYVNPIPRMPESNGFLAPARELSTIGYPTDPKVDDVDVPIQSYPFYVGGPGTVTMLRSQTNLPFVAKSVQINNVTGNWVWCNFLDTWIPPYYSLAVMNLPHGVSSVDVNPDAPPSFTNAYVANQLLTLVFFDQMQPPKGGTLLKLPT